MKRARQEVAFINRQRNVDTYKNALTHFKSSKEKTVEIHGIQMSKSAVQVKLEIAEKDIANLNKKLRQNINILEE